MMRTTFARPLHALLLILAAGQFWLPGESAKAALLAYEGFEYGPEGADVLGNNGGFGFSSPWQAGGFNASNHTNYDIGGGSLSFGPLITSGNRAFSTSVGSIAGLTRNLDVPLGTPGTTRYISFLLRPEGTLNQGVFNGFFGLLLEQPGEPELFAGKPGAGSLGQYVLEDRGGSGQISTGVSTVIDETAFLVLKAEFTAGIDTFTLFMNPTPGDPEPLVGTVKSDGNVGLAGGLTIYSTGAFSIDEIRVGETFADVTPIPEPAGWILLLVGAGLAFAASRTRRAARRGSSTELNRGDPTVGN